jgi:sodium-dependent dicarboxylate transporter 2/3/5
MSENLPLLSKSATNIQRDEEKISINDDSYNPHALIQTSGDPNDHLTTLEVTIPPHAGKTRKQILLQYFLIILGPILCFPFCFDILQPGNIKVSRSVGIVLLCAYYWVFEPIPVPISSLIPLILFPLFGIAPASEIAAMYSNDLLFLLIGTFVIAIAIEKWNLHKRFALGMLILTRGNPILILGGFLFSSYFLSMWLLNTSTTAMILPMADAIASKLQGSEGDIRFTKIMFLSIPYAALIGGIATMVGTGSNLIFVQQLMLLYPKYGDFPFLRWSAFCLPVSLVFLLTCWILFSLLYLRNYKFSLDSDFFMGEYKKLGCVKYEEIVLIVQFLIMCALWSTRELPFGNRLGWGFLFEPKFVTDGTIALFMALMLFVIPSVSNPGEQMLEWDLVNKKMPWGVNLLIGAGFSFGKAFEKAKFGEFISKFIVRLRVFPPYVMLAIVCTFIAFVSEFITNVAVAAIALPVLGTMGPKLGQNPLFFMMPIAICTSYSFMSPFTLPNAIAFAYGKFKIFDMVPIGFVLNCLGILFVVGGTYLLGGPTLGIYLNVVPDWAK